jgi:phosphoribosylglycinamide formyltransferase-1
MRTIAIFVSGNGTNCENIIRHFANSNIAKIALVLSNKQDAYALKRAELLGIPTEVLNKADFNNEKKLMFILEKYNIDFIVLAGFLLMIPDFLIHKFDHRMLNLHPALLPKFGGKGMYGMHVHEAVKNSGDRKTGMTVHWVSKECDGGEIIAQYSVALSPNDSINDIASKEHELEMKYFPSIIEKTIKGA